MESDQCPAWMGILSAIVDTKLDNKIKSLEHKVAQVMQSHQALLGTMRRFFAQRRLLEELKLDDSKIRKGKEGSGSGKGGSWSTRMTEWCPADNSVLRKGSFGRRPSQRTNKTGRKVVVDELLPLAFPSPS